MSRLFRQGYLDVLCGVYSLFNATAIVADNFRWKDAQEAFAESVRLLDAKGSLSHVLRNGIGYKDMTAIFDNVLAPVHGLQRDSPFRKHDKLPLSTFCHEVDQFLKADRHHAVIVLFENRYWVHWTVITEIKPKTIVLADSARRSFLHRGFLTTSRKRTGRSTRIYAKPTLFISRKRIDLGEIDAPGALGSADDSSHAPKPEVSA